MNIQSWSILGRSFHFGLHGMGQEKTSPVLPSDSLFAALIARLARTDSARAEKFCQPFVAGNPPFVLTSTFPLVYGLRFFPPPMTSRVPPEKSDNAKSFKKVLYVSESLYRRLLDGAMLSMLDDVLAWQSGKLWISRDEAKKLPKSFQEVEAKIWAEEQRPRVTLDRASQASTLFFTGQVTFAEHCGLWFGVRWLTDNPSVRKQFADILADLADAGLGAERNSGLGAATIAELGEFELPDPVGQWTTLSRYLPLQAETDILSHPLSSYGLKTVGGWLDSPTKPGQRRKSVNLLVEGSVFGSLPSPVPGQVADVRPAYETDPDPLKHPVYRTGLAFSVGMKGGA